MKPGLDYPTRMLPLGRVIIHDPGGNQAKGTEESQGALLVWAIGRCPNLAANQKHLGRC